MREMVCEQGATEIPLQGKYTYNDQALVQTYGMSVFFEILVEFTDSSHKHKTGNIIKAVDPLSPLRPLSTNVNKLKIDPVRMFFCMHITAIFIFHLPVHGKIVLHDACGWYASAQDILLGRHVLSRRYARYCVQEAIESSFIIALYITSS